MIGQGTWYNDNEDAGATIDALRRGLDLGMTHIDTAEMYLSGPPRILSPRRSPGDATRSSWSPRSSRRMPRGAGRSRPASGRSRVETDRLDCYLLHWRGDIRLEETFAPSSSFGAKGRSCPGA